MINTLAGQAPQAITRQRRATALVAFFRKFFNCVGPERSSAGQLWLFIAPWGPGLAVRLIPVMIWIGRMSACIAPRSLARCFLPTLRGIMAGLAKRLMIFHIPEQLHVAAVRHDVVNNTGCGEPANLLAVAAQWMLAKEPDAVFLPARAIAALSCATAIIHSLRLTRLVAETLSSALCWTWHGIPLSFLAWPGNGSLALNISF